ncbi:MAG: hypothetical protein PHC93_04610 [Candidatus Omnitrophica bacterium]|nr:hypothetical protein [Candidatus Omnitrophota bacterium]
MKPKNFPEKKAKRKEAEERVANWRTLQPEEKLNDLDRRLGKNKGAQKQRAKIEKQLT